MKAWTPIRQMSLSTECIYRIATRYILGFDDTFYIAKEDHHLRMASSLPAAKEGTMEEFLNLVFKDCT